MRAKKKTVIKKRKPAPKRAAKRVVKRAAKRVVKRVAKRAAKPVKKVLAGKKIGLITHYFPKVRAAVIKLKAPLSAGDTIRIKGHTTDFSQIVSSMQIDHVSITKAKKGDCIGLLVESRVRRHDAVSKA